MSTVFPVVTVDPVIVQIDCKAGDGANCNDGGQYGVPFASVNNDQIENDEIHDVFEYGGRVKHSCFLISNVHVKLFLELGNE